MDTEVGYRAMKELDNLYSLLWDAGFQDVARMIGDAVDALDQNIQDLEEGKTD